jgi:hypothetical protein
MIYIMICYSFLKKDSLLVTTWMSLKDIMLSEMSQVQKYHTAWCHLCVESRKVEL